MATRTQGAQGAASNRNHSNRSTSRTSGSRSTFSWGDGAGPIIAAAIGGATIGIAANLGRKALLQGLEASIGDWDEILASEHDEALALFDRILETDDTQTFKRRMLFMKLCHALDKHSHAEEMVVYPALRGDDEAADADHLEGEHGYIKTFVFELHEMALDSPNWLSKVRDFRQLVAEHAKMEEEQVFPKFKRGMTEDENAHITSLVNRDGFWMA